MNGFSQQKRWSVGVRQEVLECEKSTTEQQLFTAGLFQV